MNQSRLEQLIRAAGRVTQAEGTVLQFVFHEVVMAAVTDARHDRMRIVAPVIRVDEMTGDQIMAVLEANFHTALDARYATSDGILYAAYIHPLSPLTDDAVHIALRQVAMLVLTFGSRYSSGELAFGGRLRD